jgi:flagellar biosynthesis/type III secretory pathway M-ring protein FliF/YscJ
VVLRETANPLRDQAVATVEQRPEAAVRVIRSWMKDD